MITWKQTHAPQVMAMDEIVMKYFQDPRWVSPNFKTKFSGNILHIFDLFVNKESHYGESVREFPVIVYNDTFRIESIQSRMVG
jgi:hypothetical protein